MYEMVGDVINKYVNYVDPMYGVAGEKRSILVESDAFLYNLGEPSYISINVVLNTLEFILVDIFQQSCLCSIPYL